MARWVLGLLAVCMLVLSGGSLALAQDFDRPHPTAEDRRRAVELFEQSRHALRSGEYAEARDMLVEAYALVPQPALRLSLARAYDGLDDTANAIAQYEAYLEEDPDGPDSGEIEQRLVELRAEQREEAGTPEPPPPPAPSGPDETGPIVGFTLAGFGVAALVAGGVLAGIGASENATSRRATTTQLEAMAAHGRGRDLGMVSIGLLAGGGAMAIAGVIVALVVGESSNPPPERRPGARVGLGFGTLTIEGTF